ncbi:MAG: NAD(P)-dependent oxidoreductase [Candidatus Dormibacteraeota bacterium]|nr:NAD(P)-dependent oxidoreductase [Candidatus Dormibacteraeota bacterium]
MAAGVGAEDLVLVTGAAGRVGSALRPGLRRECRLRLLDRRPVEDLAEREEAVVADVRDLDQLRVAAGGCAAVVHLAAIPTDAPHEDLLDLNARGTYNALEAAVAAGCRRFVFASTNHVTGFYPTAARVTPEMPPRPDGLYGASKIYGEALCRLFWDHYGLEVAVLRIGSSLDRPSAPRHAHTWLSDRDLVQLVWRSLSVPDLGWIVVYGGSAAREPYWDDGAARRRLGYAPVDDAGPLVPEGPPDTYQGGPEVGRRPISGKGGLQA